MKFFSKKNKYDEVVNEIRNLHNDYNCKIKELNEEVLKLKRIIKYSAKNGEGFHITTSIKNSRGWIIDYSFDKKIYIYKDFEEFSIILKELFDFYLDKSTYDFYIDNDNIAVFSVVGRTSHKTKKFTFMIDLKNGTYICKSKDEQLSGWKD